MNIFVAPFNLEPADLPDNRRQRQSDDKLKYGTTTPPLLEFYETVCTTWGFPHCEETRTKVFISVGDNLGASCFSFHPVPLTADWSKPGKRVASSSTIITTIWHQTHGQKGAGYTVCCFQCTVALEGCNENCIPSLEWKEPGLFLLVHHEKNLLHSPKTEWLCRNRSIWIKNKIKPWKQNIPSWFHSVLFTMASPTRLNRPVFVLTMRYTATPTPRPLLKRHVE